jgi:PAS domain S-box-containing protein
MEKLLHIISFLRPLMLLICLIGTILPITTAYAAETVKIGILAYRPKPQTLAQWQPLAAVLKQAMPERDFAVEALTFSELEKAVIGRQLDFVLTNPGHYVLLTKHKELSGPLATLAVSDNGWPTTVFGGVIFSRAEQANIGSLHDINGKTIAVTGTDSMGGYQMEAYELKQAGMSLPEDAKLLVTGMPQDRVVEAVLAGRAEVGFVRSGVLEGMMREGRLDMGQLKVINRRDQPDFPALVSTGLYPEWPFASLPHIDEDLARHVAAALFLLAENTDATRSMDIYGFAVPSDYSPVADLLKELRLPPFDTAPAFNPADLWHQYQGWITAISTLLLLLIGGGAHLVVQSRKVRQGEQRFATLFAHSPEPMWLIADRRFIDCNRAALKVLGFPDRASMLGIGPADISPKRQPDGEYSQIKANLLMQAAEKGITQCFEWVHVRTDGVNITCLISLARIMQNGKPVVLCSGHDITRRKQAEAARQEAFDRLQKIAGQLPGVVFQFRLRADGSACMPYASEVLRDIYRINPEDVVDDAAKLFSVVHPDDLDGHLASIRTSARDLSPWRNEYRLKFADGAERWLFGNALPQREDDGSVLWHGFVSDITERKQIENALRESEFRWKFAIEGSGDGLWDWNVAENKVFFSKRWKEMLGFTEDEIGNDLDEWKKRIHPDDRTETLAVVQAYFDGETPVYASEHRVSCKDGSYKWILDRGIVVNRDAEGNPLRMIGTHTDITEHKQMEEKLRDSDAFNISILNSLTSHIAVLDAQGLIVTVNNAWRRFAEENGLPESCHSMLGFNYLDACKNVRNYPYGYEANAAQAGIEAVLSGDRETFHLEYPCHSPTEQRWFHMSVSPLQGSRRGAVVSHENITERKKAQESTQAAYQYSRSLIEASLDPLVTISAEGKITDVNTATEQVTGASRNHLIGSDFADYFTDPEKARDGYLQVFSQGFVTDYPLAIRHVSGRVTDVLYNASVYRDVNGAVLGVFAAARDITERREREHQLGLFHSLFELTSDCVFMVSPKQDFRFVFVNDATCQHFGVEREQLLQWRVSDWDPNFKGQADLDALWEEIKNRKGFLIQTVHRVISGELVPVEISLNYLSYNDEEYAAGYFHDITERKLMEDELKASEAKFRSIIEVSPVPMALNDGQAKITYLNPAFFQTFGYRVDDIPTLADWWTKAYPDASYRHGVVAAWQATLEQAEREHQPFSPIEVNVRGKDGASKTVLASAALISESFKNEHLVVLYDITERKQAELAKHSSEAQLRAFYELDLVGLTITSLEKGWIRINDCLCNMLEYSEQDLRRMTWAELTHPDDLAADVEQFEKLLANEIDGYALEKRFISRTGKIIPTKLVVRSVYKTSGTLDYVVAMVEDITGYKRAEAELKRSNSELEQFAYAVSHDMRQPLRMVTSYLSLIESALAGSLNEETQQCLDFAVNGAKRMDAMILSLLDYSRVGRKTEVKALIDSKASLDEALAFLNPELTECRGEIKVTGTWPELFASRDELTRLLQNLIGNALKYHEENQAPRVHIHGMISDGSLRVEVRDQGIGIEPSQMGRLFKVFSRLQARTRFDGTGVGLALCRKIVEHHGGAIGVESAGEGQGCMFWFELPMINAADPT